MSGCVQGRNDHLGGLSRRWEGELLRDRAGERVASGGGGSAWGCGLTGDARGGLTGDLTGERLPEDCRRIGLRLGPGERLLLPPDCEGDLLKRRLREPCRPGDLLSLLQQAEIGSWQPRLPLPTQAKIACDQALCLCAFAMQAEMFLLCLLPMHARQLSTRPSQVAKSFMDT